MKQLFSVTISLFIITGICRAQDSLHIAVPKTSTEKNKFYMPSRTQKNTILKSRSKLNTTAWVLLGIGTTMGVTGTILYENAAHANEWDQVGNEFGGVFDGCRRSYGYNQCSHFIRAGYYKENLWMYQQM
jgi:hypothetical protein